MRTLITSKTQRKKSDYTFLWTKRDAYDTKFASNVVSTLTFESIKLFIIVIVTISLYAHAILESAPKMPM